MSRIGDNRTRLSYLPDLNDPQKNCINEDDDNEGPAEEIQAWDVFKYFPPKLKTGSKADTVFFDRTLEAVKVCTYALLFLLVLIGEVLAKVAIIFAVAQINDNSAGVPYCDYNEPEGRPRGKNLWATLPEKSRISWYWCVFFAFVVPEIIALLSSIRQCLFKKRSWPRMNDFIFMLIVDGLHAAGLALLFLAVIPGFDSVAAVVISSCTCFVPGLLNVMTRNRKRFARGKSLFVLFGDVAAFAAQLCGILVWLLSGDDDANVTPTTRWILPIALILTSIRWWINYVSSNSSFGLIRLLSRTRERLQASRGITQGCFAIWRILIFLGTFIFIAYCKGIAIVGLFDKSIFTGKHNVLLVDSIDLSYTSVEITQRFENDTLGDARAGFITVHSFQLPLIVLLIQAASALIAYTAGKFACRTLMQGFGFALPTSLAVPATIATVVILSALRNNNTCVFHGFFPDHVFFDVPKNIGNLADFLHHWYPWIWLLTFASQAWITLHIWSPHCERLAATERIFVLPTYDSLIIDQSIILNRQIDPEIPDDDPILEAVSPPKINLNGSSLSGVEENDRVTRIIACATMWHETKDEMIEFVGSILRLDTDQGAKRFTQGYYNLNMQDYYELNTHVFFDDAFRCMHGCEKRCKHDENETQINDYVMSLIETVRESVERLNIRGSPPMKYPAPYGGRLEWTLPGQTNLIVHLKDKNKIRHRKRWSQVMYMYYLLGYHLMDRPISRDRKEVIAENTYLLTLDGDIDFRPSAVKVLVDLMKRDKDLGAACGRIHPIGTGPMVWFQKFEYAIGHWLQKSTEHTIGSVLCSPGCFSLFRAKALMEHNVMRKYAVRSTEPRHYVQYDQGEDRWLCTLILQVGYRVEYSAASDSYTHAPETFNEFYNQRRRWIPSTIANIFDLLSSSEETRKANDDVSWLYIAYQWILMGSTVLGPGTIFLMLVGAFVAAFNIDNWSSFGYNLIPIVIFVLVCVFCKENIQLIVAGIITALYGLVMIVVLVGIMIQIAEDGWVAPSTILFFVVASQLVVTGLLHPQESSCLLCGVIYYVTVPSMYMLLIIFSLFNVNNVTWGTRDSKTPATVESDQTADGSREKNKKSTDRSTTNGKQRGSIEFSLGGFFKCMFCTRDASTEEDRKLDAIAESLEHVGARLDAMEKSTDENETRNKSGEKSFARPNNFDDVDPDKTRVMETDGVEEYIDDYDDDEETSDEDTNTESDNYANKMHRNLGNFLVSPYWLQDERLRKGGVEFLSRDEETFWEELIEKYLHPIEEDKKQLAKTAKGLKNLRNEYLFKFFMLNAMFVLIVFLMQLKKEILHLEWPLGATYNITYMSTSNVINLDKDYLKLEPIGCVFIVGFIVILSVQFIAMLFHRVDTFAHMLANTKIDWCPCNKPTDEETNLEKHAENIADGLQRVVENHAGSVLARRTSTVAPGKRKTVHELVELQDKRTKLPASIDTLFRKNLNDSRSEISRLMSTRMPRSVFEAFERRRSTLVAEQKRSQVHRPESNNIYHSPDNISRENENHNHSAPYRSISYGHDNGAFISDEYSDDPSSVTNPHGPSQVTFGNRNNA